MKSITQFILESHNTGYEAALNYVKGFTTNVNDYLRSGKILISKEEIDEAIAGLDSCFKDRYDNDLYRTVDWDFMKNIFGITKRNIENHIGDVIEDKGYMSTSKLNASPWGGQWMKDELVLVIHPSTSIKCFDVNKNIDNEEIDCAEQEEVLLPRNTKLKITKYKIIKNNNCHKDGTYFVFCDVQ